jgi:hypothetical protein
MRLADQPVALEVSSSVKSQIQIHKDFLTVITVATRIPCGNREGSSFDCLSRPVGEPDTWEKALEHFHLNPDRIQRL